MESRTLRQLLPLIIALAIPIALGVAGGSIALAIVALGLTIFLNVAGMAAAIGILRLRESNWDAVWAKLVRTSLPFDLPLVCSIAVAVGLSIRF